MRIHSPHGALKLLQAAFGIFSLSTIGSQENKFTRLLSHLPVGRSDLPMNGL
ncbi:hypothetical protein MMMDOFMJ_4650 [Methylobacterium gnaphalii]|nr:hypothetical protein MMMDOFMJ_4650 [Methylobacterium gnaphalii]GLS48835.1 hypothetical protein GCM10007885_16820 [Methylobacterium gnaphalii]